MVDHTYIYSPAVRKIKDLIDSGELGEIYYVDSVRINLGLFQNDINVLWDLAPHDLSIVDHLLGRLPRASPRPAAATRRRLEDVAYLNLDFGNSLLASFHVNWLSPVKIRQMIIGGSKKRSSTTSSTRPSRSRSTTAASPSTSHRSPARHPGQLPHRRHLVAARRAGGAAAERGPPFRRMRPHGQEASATARRACAVVRILEAAQRSIKAQGGRVAL